MEKKLFLPVILIAFVCALLCGCTKVFGNDETNFYESYLDAYILDNGSDEGAMSRLDWLRTYGRGIKAVDIVCGNLTITYENGDVRVEEALFKSFAHSFSDGYDSDGELHWLLCEACGYKESSEHSFPSVATLATCSVCNYKQKITDVAYRIKFVCGKNVSLTVYPTQDYSDGASTKKTVYSKDGETGEYLKDGNGQVNFKAIVPKDYKCSVEVRSKDGYHSIEGELETGVSDAFRITKITADLEVVITAVPESFELPVMEINTENGIPVLDKETYIKSTITISNSDYILTEAAAGIRGRGNTTWNMPKKPYRIKFDKKTDLFGNGAAKSWTLIANYSDKSMLRNYIAYELGSIMESLSETTTTTQFVDLYLNGVYQGVYLVCEQMETGANRVNIEDDINEFSPESIGYLLERDAHIKNEGTENIDYILTGGGPIAIKSPDYEDIEKDGVAWNEYVDYVKIYLQKTLTALSSGDYEQVKKYIDVDSFAESYIVHELMHMVDVGYSSFYMYKKPNGKLYSGPLWDFDVSSGNCNYWEDAVDPEYLWAKEKNFMYTRLLNYPEFRELVAKKLSMYQSQIESIIESVDDKALLMQKSFDRNFELWDILDEYVWPNTDALVSIQTWQGQVEYLQEWLERSFDNLLKVYSISE